MSELEKRLAGGDAPRYDIRPYEERRREVAQKIFPFLIGAAKDGLKLKLTYNRQQLLLSIDAFKTDFMGEVEAREDIPEDLKMQIAEAVTAVSKMFPAIASQIDTGGGEVLLAVVLAMRKSLDSIVDFLEIRSKGQKMEVES